MSKSGFYFFDEATSFKYKRERDAPKAAVTPEPPAASVNLFILLTNQNTNYHVFWVKALNLRVKSSKNFKNLLEKLKICENADGLKCRSLKILSRR